MKAIILAGGKSSRMGQDKGRLHVNAKPLIEHVYMALKPQANAVIISGNQNYGLNLTVIKDLASGPAGPVGALYTVWMSLKNTADEGFFTVPVDAPNIPDDLCERLYGKDSAVAIAPDGMHQAFAWWWLDDLTKIFNSADLNNSLSLRYMACETGARQVYWEDEMLFYNINTPDDLRRYLDES